MTGILNTLIAGVSGAVKDAYFNLVSLLLPGNGTNGAQNNTFLDSSTNNFTITRNGNTTQGTFSPFSQTGWGNYFNGSSALTMPNSTAFKPGSSDFSIELWYFGTATAAQQYIWGDSDSAANNGVIALRINSTSNVAVDYFTSSTAATARTTTGTINANAWNHICVSKTGTTLYIGINGVLETFVGPSSMQSPATVNPAIGRLGAYTASGYLTGYISNFRYVVGSALYTTNPYTVPKNNLTAISGTSLLTCQSNRFLDNSANNFTITAAGSPSVVAFSPFAPTAAYTTAAVGGSGYFDGTGDYLSVADNAAFTLGTNSWTLEGWFYANSYPSFARLWGQSTGGATGNNAVGLFFDTSGIGTGINIRYGTTSNQTNDTGYITIDAGKYQWHHIAVVRDVNTMRLYFNGVQKTTVNLTGVTIYDSSAVFAIGANSSGAENWDGYLSNVRLVNGTCLYPDGTSFTPSTTPFTAITNTSLLLNFTNAGITDATAKNDLETVGNAQISTSVSKFGGGSIAFDGTGDYCVTSPSAVNDLSTGNWTIEFWVYPTTAASQQTLVNLGASASNYNGTNIFMNTSRQLVVDNTVTGQPAFSGGTLTLNTWNHVAITRVSTTTTGYINGVSVGTNSYIPNANQVVCLGYLIATGYAFNGYIDDFRITKGYARYTGNFTPPTAPFPVQ